jgi:glycosyltransferase involved in cell wall biosynthesis
VISIVIISKDEESLDDTLAEVTRQARSLPEPAEIVVVDASEGRLDHIRDRHGAAVRWLPFQRPPGVAVSIPHQRNAGVQAARGDVIVFTDAGCHPGPDWLPRLTAPLRAGEHVTAGLILGTSAHRGLYDQAQDAPPPRYLNQSGTGNLAFTRKAFDAVGGLDEAFAYGSDIDFTWRLVDAGFCIRNVPDAVIRHDFGSWRRQLRRSYVYGRARTRLYAKHRARLKTVLRDDPMVVVYPVFLLGLPLTLVFPFYPLLLLIPAWRNRSQGAARVLVDHLVYGWGVLAELAAR